MPDSSWNGPTTKVHCWSWCCPWPLTRRDSLYWWDRVIFITYLRRLCFLCTFVPLVNRPRFDSLGVRVIPPSTSPAIFWLYSCPSSSTVIHLWWLVVHSLPIMSTPTTSPQTAEEKYNLSMFCSHHYQRPVACLARKTSANCSDCSRSQPPRGYEPRDNQGYPREEWASFVNLLGNCNHRMHFYQNFTNAFLSFRKGKATLWLPGSCHANRKFSPSRMQGQGLARWCA